jgi:acetyl-CoA carboxylase alpha subunit
METIIGPLVGVIVCYTFYKRLINEEKKIQDLENIIQKIENMTSEDNVKWRDLKEVKDDLKDLFKDLKDEVKEDLSVFREVLGTLRRNVRRLKVQFIIVILILAPEGFMSSIELVKKIIAFLG